MQVELKWESLMQNVQYIKRHHRKVSLYWKSPQSTFKMAWKGYIFLEGLNNYVFFFEKDK